MSYPKKLTEKDYKEIAKNSGLYDSDTYVKFMQLRFPKEFDRYYASEWAERFKTGDPKAYMDDQSLIAYEKAKKMIKEVV